jgi:hypothetical protein
MTRALAITVRETAASPRFLAAVALLLVLSAVAVGLGRYLPLQSLLRGWLVAFAILSSASIGSMVLLMIHGLTGGRWGEAAGPVLRPAAALLPLAALAFLPVLVGLADIYPWAADPGSIAPDVARWYLRDSSFVLRAVVTLIGWSLLAVMFASGVKNQLLAGIGLAFFGFTISLVAVDWYLSLEPHFVASAFASMIAVQQMLAALALAAAIGGPAIDTAAGDIGALLIAMLLGVVYLEYMTFVVVWYGDLPPKAAWFLHRAGFAWRAVLIASFVLGAVVPLGMLLVQRVRSSRRGLRWAAALILFGTVLHLLWLLLPAFDDPGAVLGAAVAGTVGLLAVAWMALPTLLRLVTAGEPHHGP